jgi:hypothetical protein
VRGFFTYWEIVTLTYALRAALVIGIAAGVPVAAQTPAPAPAPSQQPPSPPAGPPGQLPAPTGQATAPGAPATPAVPAGPTCPAPVPPATAPARAFAAPAGLLLHPVLSTRVADFERFLLYVRDALAKTSNATMRKQAAGWEFYRVMEAGPNGDVIYAFLLDPTVPCVDYALGPILSEVYTDPAQLTEIWNLYKASVRSGGTIMNLLPLAAAPPPPIVTPPSVPATGAPGTATPGPPGTPPAPGAPGR